MAQSADAFAELVGLIRTTAPHAADALIAAIQMNLAGERIDIPDPNSITLADVELLALVKAHDGDSKAVARRLGVGRAKVLKRLQRIAQTMRL